ncbi:hypothetical protein EZS27_007458 [termite gut metagenome]|uniref:Fimbrillin family protein n=1 Tax=termite gut metagenome TaxID=433724 RepID=A0A5J4SFL3_9ZZZZ
MKQILVALPVIFSLFVLNSCDNDENLNNDDLGDKIIQFRIKALGLESGTSSESDADTRLDVENCNFENGDEIGLFAVKRDKGDALSDNDLNDTKNFIHNARLIYDSNSKSWISDPPVYYPEDRITVAIDFYAYYPYRESVNPNDMDISNGVLTNQEGRSTLGKSDFMTAYKIGYTFDEGKEVELVFRHHFSLVRLECQTDSENPLLFNSIAFFTPAYSVKKFKLIPVTTGKDLTYEEKVGGKKIAIGMHPKENAVAIYEVLLIPQIIEKKSSDGGEVPLFYCFNDKDKSFFYIYSDNIINNSEEQIELKKGNAYTFIYK